MRKSITRTMSTSTIKGFMLEIVEGNPVPKQLEPITVNGKVKEKDALKIFKDKYGKTSAITISSIDVEESTYEISVEDFVKYATKIEPATEKSN